MQKNQLPAVLDNIVDESVSAALALTAKGKGSPELEYQVILWPAASVGFSAEFYQEYTDGFVWLQE